MTHKLTHDGAAAVSPGTKWIKIGPDTPRGTKLQLISRKYGVAQSGLYTPEEKFFTHWHAFPTFDENEDD